MGGRKPVWTHEKRIALLERMGFTYKAIRMNEMDKCMTDEAFEVKVNQMVAARETRKK